MKNEPVGGHQRELDHRFCLCLKRKKEKKGGGVSWLPSYYWKSNPNDAIYLILNTINQSVCERNENNNRYYG